METARFLIYDPQEQMADGASEASSSGYFDHLDEPGWATWIDCYSDTELGTRLLCCVPPGLAEAAEAGIDANPMDCIHWVECPELTRAPDD